jgi:hypothetical protein
MHALSLVDDSITGRAISRRHREEGVATTAITFPTTIKTVQLFESVSFE